MRRRGSLFALAALLGAGPATAGVTAVWAVSDGEKVERDDRAHPLRARNAVWDGRTVRLVAARNEVVAFQVIVEADGAGLGKLSLSLPELRRRGGKEAIAYAPPATDPTRLVASGKCGRDSRIGQVWTKVQASGWRRAGAASSSAHR